MSWASKARGAAPVIDKDLNDSIEALIEADAREADAKMPRVWSEQQHAIFTFAVDKSGHLVVIARAGTGKTTTIVEAVRRYCAANPDKTVCVCAFNKRIAEELATRFKDYGGVEVKTLHALGYSLIRRFWSGIRVQQRGGLREQDLTNRVVDRNCPDSIRRLVSKLHTKAREIHPLAGEGKDLIELAIQFECEPEDFWRHQGYTLTYVCDKAYEAMVLAGEERPDKMGIDFADMIYLPVRNGWVSPEYDRVVVDECFPAGTLVRTLNGELPIEQVCVGTPVLTATGIGTVRATMRRVADKLVQVFLMGHRSVVCTPNHPFLTQHGWVAAGDLTSSHVMINAQSAWEISHDLHSMPARVSTQEPREIHASFLRTVLRREMEIESTVDTRQAVQLARPEEDREGRLAVVSADQGGAGMARATSTENDEPQSDGKSQYASSGECNTARNGPQAIGTGRQWTRTDKGREATTSGTPGHQVATCSSDEDPTGTGLADELQDRRGHSGFVAGRRSGRAESLQHCSSTSGREKGSVPRTYRVDRIEVFQPADRGFVGPRAQVYNLSVSGHPSYIVGDIVVHNCQDMTLSQLLIAEGVCQGSMWLVGDDRQSIYSFRGADSKSLDRLRVKLKATVLKLTTTYRCGRKIVGLARTLVPDFEAGGGVSDGEITNTVRARLLEEVEPGNFVLSRTNAPLVSTAMALIRKGVRTRIVGRDVGQGLKGLVQKFAKNNNSVPAFLEKVGQWESKQVARALRMKWQQRVEEAQDQAETLRHLAMDATGVQQILVRIDTLFSDDGTGDAGMVHCSSVHRAKGLEADKVFVLAWTLRDRDEEEINIKYVAITRARNHLVFVAQ